MRAIGEHELRLRLRPRGRLSLVPRASTAVYYDVFVHLKESNGATAVDTETVYRLCTS